MSGVFLRLLISSGVASIELSSAHAVFQPLRSLSGKFHWKKVANQVSSLGKISLNFWELPHHYVSRPFKGKRLFPKCGHWAMLSDASKNRGCFLQIIVHWTYQGSCNCRNLKIFVYFKLTSILHFFYFRQRCCTQRQKSCSSSEIQTQEVKHPKHPSSMVASGSFCNLSQILVKQKNEKTPLYLFDCYRNLMLSTLPLSLFIRPFCVLFNLMHLSLSNTFSSSSHLKYTGWSLSRYSFPC